MSQHRHVGSRRRAGLLGVAALGVAVLFVVLALHAGSGTRPQAIDPPLLASPFPEATVGALPTSVPATPGAPLTRASGGQLSLPPLPDPPQSSTLRQVAHGTHPVTMTVTSDKPIRQIYFSVRGGHPASGHRSFVASPATITINAHGDTGPFSQLAAQAAVDSTTLTCTTRVDGVEKARNTVHGAYALAFCIA
jgi:hypothetical protein